MFNDLGEKAFSLTGIFFIFFFVLEKFFYWRHCHDERCHVHTFTYLNLIGDTIHNFIDGTIIAASFLANFSLGLSTTLAVIFHEIPQEIGDFSILIYGGIKKEKAILWNFLSALSAFLGALFVYFFARQTKDLISYLLPLAAGNFLYLAGTDIIPELHERGKGSVKNSLYQFIAIL
ncbi:MAG: ZIP family metal transporter, partial [Candidatus Falkowbacteria bacterium]|nr:ZIP family metal transporter [Candidatus Falkowbacteria bacterium]